MVPKFLGLAQFKGNCKMPDPQNLVHLCRGLLVKIHFLLLVSSFVRKIAIFLIKLTWKSSGNSGKVSRFFNVLHFLVSSVLLRFYRLFLT